jgi:hypothetical protein
LVRRFGVVHNNPNGLSLLPKTHIYSENDQKLVFPHHVLNILAQLYVTVLYIQVLAFGFTKKTHIHSENWLKFFIS